MEKHTAGMELTLLAEWRALADSECTDTPL